MSMGGTPPSPHVREAGAGPGVVCLHCNGGNAAQWGSLMARLAPRHRVLAPDLYGAGQTAPWPLPRPRTLDDEADLIEPVLARAGEPLVLVGHSFGAAVALVAALRQPRRVRALALYEPTLFSLIEQAGPAPNDADGIRLVCEVADAAVARGDLGEAARHFIDFWGGAGSWARTPEARRPAIAQSLADVAHWRHALFEDRRTLADFASLRMPVLFLDGSDSALPARAVARLLVPALPGVQHHVLPGLGHMGPLAAPDTVNALIERFLQALD
jgi:pimeloyl-ACP methyl ester carboxylesterase